MTDLVSIPRDALRLVLRDADAVPVHWSSLAALRMALDAPAEYVSIPITDARAIAKWRKGIVPSVMHLHPCALELDRLVASLPPEHPPWEPTQEQITAFQAKGNYVLSDESVRHLLFAAHAVFEGDPT